jgi:hypothetical protein
VEVDYLSNMDGKAGAYLHSHLPKQTALDMVGDAFAAQNVHVHFDVGSTNYAGKCSTTAPFHCPDPYIIQGGTGGNAISESAVVCSDPVPPAPPQCQFPGQPTIGWKGDLLFVRDNATVPNSIPAVPLGNFQPGRGLSYHYVLFGHSLGDEESLWSTMGNALQDPTLTQLVSIMDSGATATVAIKSPQGVVKPGDCPNAAIPECIDTNSTRVTIEGALGQPALNGTYIFSNAQPDPNNPAITTFTITTANVADGTYNFANEPQLSVSYLGPTSTSGHSDFGGGADSAVTLGLWAADDPAGCQADPSASLSGSQVYCNNGLGSVQAQAGTLMHELGHTLTLTHGGTYYNDQNNPSVPTYELNCKSNFLSVMSYLFQIRGFPDGGIDYSGQTFLPLDEAHLNELNGIGMDSLNGAATHLTRWYGPPNALDTQLQNMTGGRFAKFHCDGTSIGANEPLAVRVEGTFVPGGTFSGPLDWNNNLTVPDLTEPVAWQDVNFNGSTAVSPDAPFKGFNDWLTVDLGQIAARASAFGFSGGGGGKVAGGGGGKVAGGGGGKVAGGGGGKVAGGGGGKVAGGGGEQRFDTHCSTADPPTGLSAVQSGHNVVVNWTSPGQCQVTRYDVWRAVGSFTKLADVLQAVKANPALFTDLTPKGLSAAPPWTFKDTTVKNNTTYTYFVTDKNTQGALSGASDPATIVVKF